MDVFPQLVSELTDDGLQNTEISVGIQHLKEVSGAVDEKFTNPFTLTLQVLEYNVPGGEVFT